jgi:hypothetical protein
VKWRGCSRLKPGCAAAPLPQGLHRLGATLPQLQELFADLTNMAAFHSLVVGELPGMSHQQADNFLAEMGVYESHVEAAEATDEDFFGNFS